MDSATAIDTGALAPGTRYYVYAVVIAGLISLRYSLSSEQPTGIAAYRLLGGFLSSAASNMDNIENNVDNDNPSDPVGKISAFGMDGVIDGYLPCDGRTLSRTSYADLFAIIGTTHGQGDGSTTFHLPDLRGRFLRGHDKGAGRDPDAGSRIASNAGGVSGDNVGSTQGEATKKNGLTAGAASTNTNHRHQGSLRRLNTASGIFPFGSTAVSTGNVSVSGSTATTSHAGWTNYADTNTTHAHTVTVNGGDAETRSINTNVQYGIKY